MSGAGMKRRRALRLRRSGARLGGRHASVHGRLERATKGGVRRAWSEDLPRVRMADWLKRSFGLWEWLGRIEASLGEERTNG